jgi:hypothetical protein
MLLSRSSFLFHFAQYVHQKNRVSSAFAALIPHCAVFLIFNNQTTIESFEKHKGGSPLPYNLGKRRNWEQVFGKRPLLWFVPVANSVGDGLAFERNDSPEEQGLFP